MAVYTNDLRLKEIATGDESGTWGTSTNENLSLIADAFSFGTEAITTNADTHTTTIADGSPDPGRSIFLKYTGTLDSACTITIGPNTVSKLWFIENATSGSQNIIIKQGSGATVTIANGQTKAIYSDGAGSGGAMVDAFTDLAVPTLFVEGAADISGAITSSAGATITLADNSDNLTLTTTDADANAGPSLMLFRNSSSPADSDRIATITYRGKNDAAENVDYIVYDSFIVDASNGSEDAELDIRTMVGGSETTRLLLDPAETVFNEASSDIDFRVESDGNQHAIFMEASTGNTMFGGSGFDNGNLSGSAGGVNVFHATHPIVLLKETTGNTTFYIGKSTSQNFIATEDAQPISISTSDTQRVLVEAGGNVTINEPSNDCDFRVESDNNANMFLVDAGNDHVNIGTSSDLGGVFNVFGTGAGNAKVVIEGEGGADPSLNFLANNTTHFIVGIDDSDSDKFKISQHSAFGTNDFFTVDTIGDITQTFSDASNVTAGNMPSVTGYTLLNTTNSNGSGAKLEFSLNNGSAQAAISAEQIAATSSSLNFYTENSGTFAEVIRIDNTGALRINNTRTTSTKLHVVGGTTSGTVFDTAVFAGGQNSSSGSGARIYLSGTENDPISRGTIIQGEAVDNSNAHALVFKVSAASSSPSEGMRLNQQNLGIGTTAPESQLHVAKSASGARGPTITLDNTAGAAVNNEVQIAFLTDSGASVAGTSNARIKGVCVDAGNGAADIRFHTWNGSAEGERMRLNSNGLFGVGTTLSTGIAVQSSDTGVQLDSAGRIFQTISDHNDFNRTANGETIRFRRSATQVGSISVTASATAYNTSSDYRLKENITDLTSATDRLKQLAPKRFNFKADADTIVDGFIAHEVSSIVPESITGEKDGVDDDGNPVYQGIDQSKLVPLLVATIKELEARIAALESE